MRILWRWKSPWVPDAIFWRWLEDDLIYKVYPESPRCKEIIEKALIAYYVMLDPKTNKQAKTVLHGPYSTLCRQ